MCRHSCLVFCLALGLLAGCTDYEPSYTPCGSDADCTEAGTICIEGECRDAPACQSDDECDGDRICEGGLCAGAECTQDSDCQGVARCDANRCVEVECLQSSDCQDGYHCTGYACEADECLVDGDCAYNEVCEDGVCQEREQTPCTADGDCAADEICYQGFCQVPAPCDDDLDCPGELVCEDGACAHPCVNADTDCPPNYDCLAGHCYQQCFSDDLCREPGTICDNNLCVPAECQVDADCDGELVRCVGGRCEPYTTCASDSDCTELHQVCMEGICEYLPECAIDQDCEEEPWCQDTPCICTEEHCYHVPPCETEEDCAADQDCVGGLCVPHVCRGPEDCDPGYICVAGECLLDQDPTAVVDVIILTPGGPIHQGDQIQLEAVALDAAGDAVPGVLFDWASSLPDRAAVDATGVLTGGAQAGETDVTATAQGTIVTSLPTVFTNFPDAGVDEIRVVVVLATDRTPLEGASVMLVEGANSETVVTGADGVATFTDPQTAVDIHVFSDDHDYLSILGTISKDILVPLNWRSDYSVAGGFTGQMTFPPGGSVSIGMAGTSIGGCLVDLNLEAFLGDLFTVTIEAMGYTFDMPLPSRMVARANVFVELNIKDTYYSTGIEGLRSIWAMGGNLDLEMGEIIDLVSEISSIEQILGTLLPYFAVFDHAIKPAFQVDPIPLVVDADDIDGDNDATEMRPDWGNFTTIDMQPAFEQSLAVQVSPPELPSHGGAKIATAVFMAGSLSSLGFTPLGLTAEEAAEGVVEPLTMKLAPAYGGLEAGRYAMLVMGFPTEGSAEELPTDVAIVAYTGWDLPTDVTFESGFLAFPEDAVYVAVDRSLTGTRVAGATLLRSTVQGPMGKWEVYLSNADVLAYTLPDPPAGMDDLAGGEVATLDPVALEAGTTFEDLITFNGDDLDQINRLATAFTRYEL